MPLLKKVFRFIIFGNLYIAICAVAQSLLTYRMLNLQPRSAVIVVVFAGTCFIYNFSILKFDLQGISAMGSVRQNTISRNYLLMKVFAAVSVLSLIPCLFFLKPGTLMMLMLLSSLSVLYSLPVFKWKNESLSLRNLPGLKAILISFIWTMSTNWIPAYESGIHIARLPLFLMLAERFLFIASICIEFDIRDISQDRKKKVYTIPALIGKRRSKILSLSILLAYAILISLPASLYSVHKVIPMLITLCIVIYFILYSEKRRNDYYYHFWLDGVLILQYLLIILF